MKHKLNPPYIVLSHIGVGMQQFYDLFLFHIAETHNFVAVSPSYLQIYILDFSSVVELLETCDEDHISQLFCS
jgi:hypothetical protein